MRRARLTTTWAAPCAAALRTPPVWLQVWSLYLGCRALSLGATALVRTHDDVSVRGPDLLTYLATKADGAWYRSIAAGGYPGALPIGPDGAVVENPWAFHPAYPLLVRGVQAVTGAPWEVAAPLVALAAGGLAMLLVHHVVAEGAPRAVAARPGLPLATVAVLSVHPASPTLQAAYSESVALAALAWALLALVRRDYLRAAVAVLVLGVVRPVAVPVLAVVLVHGVMRWRGEGAGPGGWDRASRGRWAVLVVAAAGAGVIWPLAAGRVTGVPDAYVQTQGAWREGRPVGPFAGWVPAFQERPALLPLVAVAVVALGVVLTRRSARRLGPELWTWTLAYVLYLAAVLEPHTSMVRFSLLAFPLVTVVLGWVARPPGRARAWAVAVWVASLAAQLAWLWFVWRAVLGDAFDPSP